VRSLLLSGAIAPEPDPWARDRAAAMLRAIGLVCRRSGRCSGPAVTRDLRRLADRLRRTPVPFALAVGGRRYPQVLDDITLALVVFASHTNLARYGRVPALVRQALAGHPDGLIRLARRDLLPYASLREAAARYSGMAAIATRCADGPAPYDRTAPPDAREAQFRRARAAAGRAGPFRLDSWITALGEGAWNCLDWPAPTAPGPADGGPLPAVPALVANGDLDANTPPAGGRALAGAIPGAHFLEVPNVGHVPEFDETGCVARIYWRFLRTHRVAGLRCLRRIPPVRVP
jgi:TAP-like protein